MIRDRLAERLHALDAEHEEDGDGGYALVGAIIEWIHSLSDKERAAVWQILLDTVESEEPTLWGVALEVLAREKPRNVLIELAASLKVKGIWTSGKTRLSWHSWHW